MADSTLSPALQEAYASATAGAVIYETLEINCSTFGAFRLCKNNESITARLESTALYDANTYVTFANIKFDIVPPSMTEGELPTMQISIDNISRDLSTLVLAAQNAGAVMRAVYREFLSTDLTAPANTPPLTLPVTNITENAMVVTATCSFVNIANKRWPRNEYNALDFAGLVY